MGVEGFPRDYGLKGPKNARAVAAGLANAECGITPTIPRARTKALMKRSDGPATGDTVIWLGSLVLFGALGVNFWGAWWAVPCFLVYGVLYGSGGDSRCTNAAMAPPSRRNGRTISSIKSRAS